MTRDELYVGAKWLVNKLLDPDNFEARLLAMSRLIVPPPWVARGLGERRRPLMRRKPVMLFSRVMHELTRRDRRVAKLVQRTYALMRERPEIREILGDSLAYYLISLRGYEADGVYERGWAQLPAPPFGTATADARLQRIRALA